ncbi:androgen-binding protein homolog [Moschus berezovskii]|uniref:androgen-binding protein homolog n=1 Tax=Moschus berezovskii TaxID=68408 RepID=UPI00244455D6|nr:androgen-binding protein homolog [Moschus berezovskii]
MMKGALLVLALMVTRELIFETSEAEACPAFYTVFGVLSLGNKELLNVMLDQFNATDEEKAALGKIQDCFNEAGFEVKFLDMLLMSSITLSKDCIEHSVSSVSSVVNSIL